MTALVTRIVRRTLVAMFFSVLGGSLLLWLAANGLDLQKDLAALFRLAQRPEYRPYTFPALVTLSIGALLLLVVVVVNRMDRPPRATVLALRRAAVTLQQEVLVPIPEKDAAEAACRSLEQLLHEVEPFEATARRVREVLDLSHSFLLGIAQGEEELAALHDRALGAVDRLMQATRWAAEAADEG